MASGVPSRDLVGEDRRSLASAPSIHLTSALDLRGHVGLVPGLDLTLDVTLEAGDYTFARRLNGHDLAGMTGTLKVT